MYYAHPSRLLQTHFSAKPYQGAVPERAKFVFIGLDANYASDIESSPVFSKILEYHRDGSEFWRKHGVHHPFLLPKYKGSGKKFHREFSRANLGAEHADQISFLELVNVPTTGISNLTVQDLAPSHMCYLKQVFLDSAAQYIFVTPTVRNLLNATGEFNFPLRDTEKFSPLLLVDQQRGKTVLEHYHFSNYGIYQAKKLEQIEAIGRLVRGP